MCARVRVRVRVASVCVCVGGWFLSECGISEVRAASGKVTCVTL